MRYWPYNGNLNFSKDWSDECDIPCVWTGKEEKADGVFYIIRNDQEARWAFDDNKVVPISIGGTTEGAHYYPLLTIPTFLQHFTASSFIDTKSDIPWVVKVSSYEDMQSVPQVQNPIKKAVTAIFNCAPRNNRESMVKEMSNIVPIDSIGKCSNNAPWPLCGEQPCNKDEVLRKYMFCLVFENGVSPGFVSEKIHQCFRAGSLPIWYGTDDVALIVPEGSYVNMKDFESHLALAEYMVQLINNETLYDSYFEWKKRPLDADFVRRNRPFWEYKVQCRVCRYVWVKQRGLTWDRVTQNATTIGIHTPHDSNQLTLSLDKTTSNIISSASGQLDLTSETGTQNNSVTSVNLSQSAPLNLSKLSDSEHASYDTELKLALHLNIDARNKPPFTLWTILAIVSIFLTIMITCSSRVIRFSNYLFFKWHRFINVFLRLF